MGLSLFSHSFIDLSCFFVLFGFVFGVVFIYLSYCSLLYNAITMYNIFLLPCVHKRQHEGNNACASQSCAREMPRGGGGGWRRRGRGRGGGGGGEVLRHGARPCP